MVQLGFLLLIEIAEASLRNVATGRVWKKGLVIGEHAALVLAGNMQ
jgi:hypothetical protein